MAEFIQCFNSVLKAEGGYKLHTVPGDRGGMTYAGISRVSYPDWPGWSLVDNDTTGNVLTKLVEGFYHEVYWKALKGDLILSQVVAYCLYDFAVNAGKNRAIRLCQQLLGTTQDGVFGPITLRLLNDLIQNKKDEQLFEAKYGLLKVFYYKDICMRDSRRDQDVLRSNQKFLCGWINRVQQWIENGI